MILLQPPTLNLFSPRRKRMEGVERAWRGWGLEKNPAGPSFFFFLLLLLKICLCMINVVVETVI